MKIMSASEAKADIVGHTETNSFPFTPIEPTTKPQASATYFDPFLGGFPYTF